MELEGTGHVGGEVVGDARLEGVGAVDAPEAAIEVSPRFAMQGGLYVNLQDIGGNEVLPSPRRCDCLGDVDTMLSLPMRGFEFLDRLLHFWIIGTFDLCLVLWIQTNGQIWLGLVRICASAVGVLALQDPVRSAQRHDEDSLFIE